MENVYSALQAVVMPTEEEDLCCFLAGPLPAPEVQRSSAKKATKSALKAEGVRTLQVTVVGVTCGCGHCLLSCFGAEVPEALQ